MRKDLNMRKGKMIAQGAHASLKVLLDRGTMLPTNTGYAFTVTEPMRLWLTERFAKICVSVDSEAALDEVVDKARAAGLPVALIVDSGATEFKGVPTKTCCAVGPAWSDDIDAVTGALPLL